MILALKRRAVYPYLSVIFYPTHSTTIIATLSLKNVLRQNSSTVKSNSGHDNRCTRRRMEFTRVTEKKHKQDHLVY